jgi:3-oxoacyl-[acyl-carrier protein] reductase
VTGKNGIDKPMSETRATKQPTGERPMAGKIAWVTGSSRGIGRVIADHLASLGASVAVHGTSPTSTRAFNEADSLEAVARAIAEQHGVEALAVAGDLTSETRVDEIVAEIRARFGRIDILVNCAGGDIGAQGVTAANAGKPQKNDAVNISVADLRTVLERNLMTCILPCRAVAPEMLARKRGWIVNIGSVSGLSGREGEAIYSTAKAAVHEYSRCLAAQARPHNVCVNVVAPGGVITPRFLASRPVDEARKVKDGTLIRYGWPEEIAKVVAFLASDASSYISGQVLRVDGGEQLFPA